MPSPYDLNLNQALFNAVPQGSTCLDVGCWTGNLGRKLIAEKNCVCDGIDIDRSALAKATQAGYRRTVVMDLNNKDVGIPTVGYDVLIFSDVLEHCIDPWRILRDTADGLPSRSVILISLPNAAFASTRLSLLLGRFEYDPNGGLMDIGHLRFFTAASTRRLCVQAGLRIERFSGVAQVRARYFFLPWLARLWPSLFALQFLLRCRKASS